MKKEDNSLAKSDKDKQELPKKSSLKKAQALAVANKIDIARFLGAVINRTDSGWERITSDDFARICYKTLGLGTTRSQIQDLEHLFFTSANDISHMARYIGMPDGRVWDTIEVGFTTDVKQPDCVFQLAVNATEGKSHEKWLLDLACDDHLLMRDIMWALAPIFMHRKPFGVFWFIGGGR